jgi:thiol-disulfide isomerase/thioredoxin
VLAATLGLSFIAWGGLLSVPKPWLAVDDPAPQLQAGQWVQGEPVTEFDLTNVYLIEFWATWCAPCIASIPHLNELACKFEDRGLVVIGKNVFENNENLVESFRDRISYRIALDDKYKSAKGAMAETWQAAAGQTGIPCSCLIDKDKHIAWIGHPSDLTKGMIEEVLAGNFDAIQLVEKICNRLDTDYQKAQMNAWQNLACLARISFIKCDKEKAIQHQQEAMDVENQYR